MLENCDVMAQFGAIQKPDSGAWSVKFLLLLQKLKIKLKNV